MEELGAGEVVGGIVDVYSKVKEPVRIAFEPEKINALLGTDISANEMLDYFRKIDLEYDEKTNEVIAPTFRHDLFCMADLAEGGGKILRIRQYSDNTSERRGNDRKITV